MKSAKLLLVIWLGLLSSAQALAEDEGASQACPNPVGWKPTDEQLNIILSDHNEWVAKWPAKYFKAEWAAQNPGGEAPPPGPASTS
jgi:hypothetical protein